MKKRSESPAVMVMGGYYHDWVGEMLFACNGMRVWKTKGGGEDGGLSIHTFTAPLASVLDDLRYPGAQVGDGAGVA